MGSGADVETIRFYSLDQWDLCPAGGIGGSYRSDRAALKPEG